MKITEELLSVLECIENSPELKQGYYQQGINITANTNITIYSAHWGLSRVFGATWWVNIYTSYFFIYKGSFYWIARFDPMCLAPFENFKFSLMADSCNTYAISDTNSMLTKTLRHPVFKSNHILCAKIPNEFIGHQCSVKFEKQNGMKAKGNLIVFNRTDIEFEEYDSDFQELRVLLNQFDNISVEQELNYFQACPRYIKVVIDCLNRLSNNESPLHDLKKYLHFKIPTTYDKKYYCAAKIADSAQDISVSSDGQTFYVSFTNTQLEEIELTRFLIAETNTQDDSDIRNYLMGRSRTYQIIYSIQEYINSYNEQHGYSSEISNSVLSRIIKNEKKRLQNKIDIIYSVVVSENRVPVKWTNEYHLFSIISSLVEDAVYQYKANWLGNQSLDIYLTNNRVGIEYQGKQHYEAVEYFGGKDALVNNRERDRKKREICIANNVKLLEWPYTDTVNLHSVTDFLLKNDISIKPKEKIHVDNIMAPCIKTVNTTSKIKKIYPKIIRKNILQYDLQGNLLEAYTSISEAASMNNISSTSISKVLKGERNVAGGYIWKKIMDGDNVKKKIDITENLSHYNLGIPKRIGKLDNHQKIEVEYESISEASRRTKISKHHITNELAKVNSKEWKYL